jgi:hypothetical protein
MLHNFQESEHAFPPPCEQKNRSSFLHVEKTILQIDQMIATTAQHLKNDLCLRAIWI